MEISRALNNSERFDLIFPTGLFGGMRVVAELLGVFIFLVLCFEEALVRISWSALLGNCFACYGVTLVAPQVSKFVLCGWTKACLS